MNIDTVISQLRTFASPTFGNNVAGAAAYANGVEGNVWLSAPALYVMPLEEDATENLDKTGPGLKQVVTERVGVILMLDNSTDKRGQVSASQIDAMRMAIWAAMLNWNPDRTRSTQGLFYMGGQNISIDRARFFYQFTFGWNSQISGADGYQPTSAVQLLTLNTAITDQASGKPLATQTISIPQS